VQSSMMIRGENGQFIEKAPLYVIDGVIGGDISMIRPGDRFVQDT